MIKYYNSLSWRLGTQLKTREPDLFEFDNRHQGYLKKYFLLSTLFVLSLFSGQSIFAQGPANDYTFATSTGATLDPMTGSTLIGAAPNDDTPYAASSIGFNFVYETTTYTQFSASPDGFMRLGGTTASSQFSNALTSATNVPKLAPLWDDLALGSLAGGGSVRVLTTGTAPNRICKIQWFVTAPRATGGAANSTFQVWLYETTNVIEFRYGTVGIAPSSSVGIVGSTATNFQSVTLSSNTASNVTANNSNSVAPASGRMYTFTPPVILTPPNCATGLLPADLATDVARNTTFSWTAATGGPTSYDVYLGTTTPAPLVANVGVTSYLSPSALLPNTLYYYKIVPKNNNGDAVGCVEQSFTTGADLIFCNPGYTSGKTDGDLISNIVIGGTTLANNSGTSPVNPSYTYFTGLPNYTAELQAGATYTVTISVGTFGGQNVAAWIDYNDNGVFETSERIGFTTSSIAANGTANFNITLACNPPLGTHRLRVRDVWNTTGNLIDPCTTYGFGETEDYDVTVTAADPCPAPGNLAVSNITQTTADLSWTLGCAETAWEVVVQATGLGEPAGAGEASASTTFAADELTLGTDYEFYVRAVCETGVLFSDWTGPFAFSTIDNPPACTTLISPADGATGVAIIEGLTQLTWSAPATSPTEGAATSYDVFRGTTSGSLTFVGNVLAPVSGDPSFSLTGMLYNQTYFWRIVPVNSGGEAVGPCAEWSFTTENVPANDICTGAVNLDLLTSPLSSATTGFSDNYSPSCNGTNTAPDSFYSITVPNGFTLSIGQTENNYDSVHALFYGSCAAQTEILCLDDADTTTANWTNTTGSTQTVYWVQDGFGAGSGTFTLGWSLTPPPVVVTTFAPDAICGEAGGDSVVITGSNFTGATSVQFNGIEATSFVVDSDTQITAVVPAGNTEGVITVFSEPSTNGSASSANALVVNPFPVVNPITGADTALCMPNTLLLSSTSPGGTWSSSNEAVATVVGGTVTGVAEGTVTISYSVTDNGCTTVVTYDVDVNEPVVISSFTPSQTIVTGNDATFTVSATGSGLTYQWFAFDGIDTYELDDLLSLYGESYSGSTSSSLVVGSVPSDMNGFEFYCEVSGLSPCTAETTTPNSILNVGDTGIGSDPSSVSLCDGGSTTFTVVRSGDDLEEDITYSWEYDADGTDNWQPVADGNLDGMTIADSDTNVLSVSTITLVHDGYRFRAVVTGPANAATSNPAILTVNEGVAITDQPDSVQVCRVTTTANFSVATSGVVTGIQWQVSPNGVDTWSNVGTGASLNVNITPATPVGVTYYRAVVSGTSPCLPLNSDVVTLTVQQPTISVTPSSATFCSPGEPVTLTASGAVSYSWSPASGLSSTTGDVVTASPTVTTLYTVTGTDANGCTNTTTVNVTVGNAVQATATSNLATVCPEAPVQLSASGSQAFITSNVNLYTLQAVSGTFTPIVGGTSTGLSATADDDNSQSNPIGFTFNYGGTNYTNFRVSSNGLLTFNATGNGSATNNLATSTASFRPGIAVLWDDLQCTSGATYQVSGTAPNRVLTVQWLNVEWNWSSTVGISFQAKLYESTNVIELVYRQEAGGNPAGSSGASIGLMGTATNSYLSLQNSSASPTTSTTASTNNITTKPATGQVYRFIPGNQPTFTYSWTSEPAGFTSSAQNPVANPSEDTTYTVVVTGAGGCSTTAQVSVEVVSGALIETQPVSLTQCEGTDASFSVSASGPSLTYQWSKDGNEIDGATSATLELTDISLEDDGDYSVEITPLCGAAIVSDTVTLTVNALPTAVASSNGPVCEGSTLNLTGTSDIGATFSWTGPNGFSSTDQNPSLTNVTVSASGTYTFTATTADDCSTSGSTVVSIIPNPELEITSSGSATTACVGELKQLTASPVSTTNIILSENFNGATNGWTTENLTTGGANPANVAWTLRPSPFTQGSTFTSNDASQYYLSNPDAAGSGVTANARLQSPTFSTVGYSAVNVSYFHYYRHLTLTQNVEYSVDGVNWVSFRTYNTTQGAPAAFVQDTVALPAGALNQPSVSIRFRYQDGWAWYWAIDNFQVVGTLSTPTITWSPTTDLYTDAAGTVPYTGTNAATVYAKVSETSPTSYTASSLNGLGCEREANYSFELTTTGCPSTTVVVPTLCGTTLAAVNSYVYANIVSGAQGYRFRVTNMSTNEVQTIDQLLRAFRITQLTNYAFNTTYMVEVAVRRNNVWESFYGTGCTVTTPDTTTQIQASQCNTTLSNINNSIFADIVPFATGYRFRVTNTLNPIDVQTIDRPIRDFKMSNLTSFEYNTTYNVEVAVRNTDGTYLSYGPVCNISTPMFPTVGLEDAQCDDYQVISNSETIFAESYPGAEQYRFLLENLGQPYNQTFDRPIRTVTLNNFTGLLPGETYTVRVAIRLNGVWGPYGKSCSIITPGAARPDEVTRIDESAVNEFKAIAYPNPFATSFAIDVRTSNTETVSLTVYDMAGRLLEVKEVKAQDASNYQFGDRYPSGVYNVIVTQGNETRAVRVVKQ